MIPTIARTVGPPLCCSAGTISNVNSGVCERMSVSEKWLRSHEVGPASRAGLGEVPLGSRHLPAVGPASRAGLGEVALGSRHLPAVGPASRAGLFDFRVPLGSRHLPAVGPASRAGQEQVPLGSRHLLKPFMFPSS